jgi:hypothetical protein
MLSPATGYYYKITVNITAKAAIKVATAPVKTEKAAISFIFFIVVIFNCFL